jgi:hypothetical protein
MDETVSSLDKVRDAIHVIGLCPGWGRLSFHIPKWTGVMEHGYMDTLILTDAEIDLQMDNICKKTAPPPPADQPDPPAGVSRKYRAAEVSEIMLRALEDLPLKNTADVPLFGKCPNCEGNADDPEGLVFHASGHARVCWDPDAQLNMMFRRMDSTAGMKSMLCVEEFVYTPDGHPEPHAVPTLAPGVTIPHGCRMVFDGCNTCEMDTNGGVLGCTELTCTVTSQPDCHQEF